MANFRDLTGGGVFTDQCVSLVRSEPDHQQEADEGNTQDQQQTVNDFVQYVRTIARLVPAVDFASTGEAEKMAPQERAIRQHGEIPVPKQDQSCVRCR